MPRRARIAPLAAALVLAATGLCAGCRREPEARGVTRYPVEGQVVEVDRARARVTLAHDEIPGFMPAMAMPFVVLEPDAPLLAAMAPGDRVTAELVVADSRYWLEHVVVVKPQVKVPGAAPTAPMPREPAKGDRLPDVALVDQHGKRLRLSDFRGRALALSFVFTRCPLPDFCPFLMRGFARAHEVLVADPSLARATALLTVSFDVEHDTPEVLLVYGRPFQKTTPPFSHWRLATGRLEDVRRLGEACGLEFRDEERSFTHNLRTAVVDRDGRLRALLRGNEWKPEELVAELKAAAGR